MHGEVNKEFRWPFLKPDNENSVEKYITFLQCSSYQDYWQFNTFKFPTELIFCLISVWRGLGVLWWKERSKLNVREDCEDCGTADQDRPTFYRLIIWLRINKLSQPIFRNYLTLSSFSSSSIWVITEGLWTSTAPHTSFYNILSQDWY